MVPTPSQIDFAPSRLASTGVWRYSPPGQLAWAVWPNRRIPWQHHRSCQATRCPSRRAPSSEARTWLSSNGCPASKSFCRGQDWPIIAEDWSHSFRFVVESRVDGVLVFVPFGMPVRRMVFLEGSRQLCRPIPLLPAAIAVRHLRSPAASRISTPAAASASRVAALIVAPPERRSATAGDRRTAATARRRHTVGANARSVRCSARPARAAARRLRCHSSPAATSPSTARVAFSNAAVETDRVVTAGAVTKW